MIVKGPTQPPVTFDGALSPELDRKSVLEQRKRTLEKELKEVEAEIGQS